jgi:hypothetical protein
MFHPVAQDIESTTLRYPILIGPVSASTIQPHASDAPIGACAGNDDEEVHGLHDGGYRNRDQPAIDEGASIDPVL